MYYLQNKMLSIICKIKDHVHLQNNCSLLSSRSKPWGGLAATDHKKVRGYTSPDSHGQPGMGSLTISV